MAEVIDGRRVIQASEIMDKIQKGEPVECKSVIIEGALDIRKLDLPIQHIERTETQKQVGLSEDVRVVKSSIRIIDSVIHGGLNFSDSIFSDKSDFTRAMFSGDANFNGTSFGEHALFYNELVFYSINS